MARCRWSTSTDTTNTTNTPSSRFACVQTATTRVEPVDEVITLAAAMHYGGSRHVIGTLWSVYDDTAADVSESVHRDLAGSLAAGGRPKPTTPQPPCVGLSGGFAMTTLNIRSPGYHSSTPDHSRHVERTQKYSAQSARGPHSSVGSVAFVDCGPVRMTRCSSQLRMSSEPDDISRPAYELVPAIGDRMNIRSGRRLRYFTVIRLTPSP